MPVSRPVRVVGGKQGTVPCNSPRTHFGNGAFRGLHTVEGVVNVPILRAYSGSGAVWPQFEKIGSNNGPAMARKKLGIPSNTWSPVTHAGASATPGFEMPPHPARSPRRGKAQTPSSYRAGGGSGLAGTIPWPLGVPQYNPITSIVQGY